MPWNRVQDGFNQYVVPYVSQAGSNLTKVAVAVYQNQPVKDFLQGSYQFFRLPAFLMAGERTRRLLMQSAKTNIFYFLIPAVMAPRFLAAVTELDPYEVSPLSIQHTIDWMLWSVMALELGRIYLRRLRDNGAYFAGIPALTAYDVTLHLPRALAEGLTDELTKMFDKIFLSHVRVSGDYTHLLPDLNLSFTLFFKKKMTAETFQELQKNLSDDFEKAIKNQDLLNVDEKFIHTFSVKLAKNIVAKLAKNFGALDNTIEKMEKNELQSVLRNAFFNDVATRYAMELESRISRIDKSIQSFLPIVRHPGCECANTYKIANINTPGYYERMAKGALSAAIYDAGNLFSTYLPVLLAWFNLISDNTFYRMSLFALFTQILIVGYMLEQYRLSSWYCNRHRSELLGSNIFYGLGLGAAQKAIGWLGVQSVLWLTKTRNPLTDTAVDQLVFQAFVVTMMVFNDALPNNKNSKNWFYLPQQATRLVMGGLMWLFLPDPLHPGVRGAFLEKMKNFMASKILYDIMWLIWGVGEIFPAPQPKMLDAKTGNLVQSDPLTIVLDILFKNEATGLILGIHNKNISQAVDTVSTVQKVSEWVAAPLLALPLPGAVVAPLKVLKEPATAYGLKKIQRRLQDNHPARSQTTLTLTDETVEKFPDMNGIAKDIDAALAEDIFSLPPAKQKPPPCITINDDGYLMVEEVEEKQAVIPTRSFNVQTEQDDKYIMVEAPQKAMSQGLMRYGLLKAGVQQVASYVNSMMSKNVSSAEQGVELLTYSYRK